MDALAGMLVAVAAVSYLVGRLAAKAAVVAAADFLDAVDGARR